MRLVRCTHAVGLIVISVGKYRLLDMELNHIKTSEMLRCTIRNCGYKKLKPIARAQRTVVRSTRLMERFTSTKVIDVIIMFRLPPPS